MDLKCRISNEDPRAPSEMKWLKISSKILNEEYQLPNETLFFYSNKTPKFLFVQDCASNGRCKGNSGEYEYVVDNPHQLFLANVTLDDKGLYW